MIFVTRTETVSLAEIPPPCFLTSGFIQRQYPLHNLCFPSYVFTLLEYRKTIILGQDKEDYLKVIVWSRLILRGRIHLSSHNRGVLHDLPSSPRPFCLLLLLSREVPH